MTKKDVFDVLHNLESVLMGGIRPQNSTKTVKKGKVGKQNENPARRKSNPAPKKVQPATKQKSAKDRRDIYTENKPTSRVPRKTYKHQHQSEESRPDGHSANSNDELVNHSNLVATMFVRWCVRCAQKMERADAQRAEDTTSQMDLNEMSPAPGDVERLSSSEFEDPRSFDIQDTPDPSEVSVVPPAHVRETVLVDFSVAELRRLNRPC